MKNLVFALVLLSLVGCKSTFERESVKASVRDLAKKEYNLDVEVAENGKTLGVQYRVQNILAEWMAEDQLLQTNMENLLTIMRRVALSLDTSPDFLVVDIVDEDNPNLHFVLTRYVNDVRRAMVEGSSRSQFIDRLLMEFHIGEKRLIFDPYETDLVRVIMMALDVEDPDEWQMPRFELEDVYFPDFLAKVTTNTLRRLFREESGLSKKYTLRKVEAGFEEKSVDANDFRVSLDLIAGKKARRKPNALETKVLPRIADEVSRIFKSYRFTQFTGITIIEKNSGKLFMKGR